MRSFSQGVQAQRDSGGFCGGEGQPGSGEGFHQVSHEQSIWTSEKVCGHLGSAVRTEVLKQSMHVLYMYMTGKKLKKPSSVYVLRRVEIRNSIIDMPFLSTHANKYKNTL